MKKSTCPSCGQFIYGKADSCPYCGAPLVENCPYDLKRRKKVVTIGIVAGVAIMICNIVGGITVRKELETYLDTYLDKPVSKNLDVGEIQVGVKKTPKADKELDSEEIGKLAREAVDSYNTGAITYDEASRKIENLSKTYKAKFEDEETIRSILTQLQASKASFDQGAAYEQKNEYENAYVEYDKVINEDGKYEDAKAGKERVKTAMVGQYENQAKEKADNRDYDSAISIIDNAIKKFPDDASLAEIKKTYETAKSSAEKDKAKQFELKKGKEIKTDHIKATFKGASFTSSIKPDNTKNTYRYYKTRDSKKIWLDLKFTIKNTSKEDFDLGTMVSDMQVLAKGSKYQCIFGAYSSSGSNIDFVGITGVIKSGKSVTYHLIAELPKDMEKSKDSLEVKFYLDGEKQELKYR